MQTLLMLTNADITLRGLMDAVSGKYGPKQLDDTTCSIEKSRENGTVGYIRIFTLENPGSQYDENEVLPLAIGAETRGFLIEFNDLALLKEVMPYIADREDLAIDDDHGSVVIGTDFVASLRTSTALALLPEDYET